MDISIWWIALSNASIPRVTCILFGKSNILCSLFTLLDYSAFFNTIFSSTFLKIFSPQSSQRCIAVILILFNYYFITNIINDISFHSLFYSSYVLYWILFFALLFHAISSTSMISGIFFKHGFENSVYNIWFL